MNSLSVPDPKGFLYIIADSHLDEITAPAGEFVEMLTKLEDPHTIVCLGDLFKIWLAPQKFWTSIHHNVFSGFKALSDRGVNVVFIAGNREMLLPKKMNEKWKKILPFTHLSNSDWFLNWGGKNFAFIHGDTINYNDKNYLRWKAFTHNRIFEKFFEMIPSHIARLIAEYLEKLLSKTNKKYKVYFPEKEVQEFAKSVLDKVDQYFVGHFHVQREIRVEGLRGILRIVPDWLTQRKILKINKNGEIHVQLFKGNYLENIY